MRAASAGSGLSAAKGLIVAMNAAQTTARASGTHAESDVVAREWQLKSIDRLRRGTLSRQVFTREQDGRTMTQGPYFVLQGFQGGRKFSQRIPAPAAERVQEQVDNFKQFQALADQCISLTDQITQLAEGLTDAKKNSRSPKSRPSNSGKPKRS